MKFINQNTSHIMNPNNIDIVLNLSDMEMIADILKANIARRPDLSGNAVFRAKFNSDLNAFVIDNNATARQLSGFAECNPAAIHLPHDKK